MSEAARPPASRSSPWITAALSSARKMAAIASAARAASVVAIFVSDLDSFRKRRSLPISSLTPGWSSRCRMSLPGHSSESREPLASL
jgi:hypothetical protein